MRKSLASPDSRFYTRMETNWNTSNFFIVRGRNNEKLSLFSPAYEFEVGCRSAVSYQWTELYKSEEPDRIKRQKTMRSTFIGKIGNALVLDCRCSSPFPWSSTVCLLPPRKVNLSGRTQMSFPVPLVLEQVSMSTNTFFIAVLFTFIVGHSLTQAWWIRNLSVV